MGHIFISYSHKDKAYVHKLQEALQAEGFEVWIDDRIDYGTQWPKVIQDQLDTCNTFIVVVSENSYESEWVQNEVTRAKRKRKPFFPLLLSGEPWLSVETTQYIDVSNGALPSDDFFRKLEEFTERVSLKLSHDLAMVTFSWLTYTDPKNIFSFQYPPDSEFFLDKEGRVRIWLPTIPGTNVDSKQLTVSYEKKEGIPDSINSEFEGSNDFLIKRQIVKINGRKYLRETSGDAAMGKWSELTQYSTTNSGIVVTFAFEIVIRSQEPHAYLLPKMDLDAERELLLYVLHTFSWLSSF